MFFFIFNHVKSEKMRKIKVRFFVFLLINYLIWAMSFNTCDGNGDEHRQHRKVLNKASLFKEEEVTESLLFNVLEFGAKGDRTTDDTKAFEEAWASACKEESSTLLVPSGFQFLVKPLSFAGPNCASNIVFQLDGTIMAPKSILAYWSDPLQWLNFSELNKFTIQGKGTIEGRGSIWWDWNESLTDSESVSQLMGIKLSTTPTALRFYGSSDVTVTGITIQNSPQCHLKFDDCSGVEVYNVSISSPAESPNTDGIHLQNSRNVVINNVNLACGDDCISIQTGSSNVYIHDVKCGPGHGISIGGLGKDNSRACVSNVTVKDVILEDTLSGVRIKTWQGGSGTVEGITFTNIQVSNVETPITIDQYYCDKSSCTNKTRAVGISGIWFNDIKGTYTMQPLHLACSSSQPCKGITISNIELEVAQGSTKSQLPFCWKAYGDVKTTTVPVIDCLQAEEMPTSQVQSISDAC